MREAILFLVQIFVYIVAFIAQFAFMDVVLGLSKLASWIIAALSAILILYYVSEWAVDLYLKPETKS